jgi:hypothetical protein
MSPFEHQAQVWGPYGDGTYGAPFGAVYTKRGRYLPRAHDYAVSGYFCGNFRAPWLQYRKTFLGEAVAVGAV